LLLRILVCGADSPERSARRRAEPKQLVMIRSTIGALHYLPLRSVPLLGQGLRPASAGLEKFTPRPDIVARERDNARQKQRFAAGNARCWHDSPPSPIPVLRQRPEPRE